MNQGERLDILLTAVEEVIDNVIPDDLSQYDQGQQQALNRLVRAFEAVNQRTTKMIPDYATAEGIRAAERERCARALDDLHGKGGIGAEMIRGLK